MGQDATQTLSMSVVDFGRLSGDMQREVLVKAFQMRLKYSRNLYHAVDLFLTIHHNTNGRPGPIKEKVAFRRCRAWQLNHSFRVESDMFEPGNDQDVVQFLNSGFDSQEGVARSTVRFKEDRRSAGRIDTVPDRIIIDDRYIYWLDGSFRHREEYLFHNLLDHRDEFEVAILEDGRLQLTVPYQPWWAKKAGGKRKITLDPLKGFLPIRGDSRWDGGPSDWRIERFVVEQSRQVGDIWMPIKIHEEICASPSAETFAVYETVVVKIEHGKVTPADLHVPFTKGMQVVDAIKGVTYIADVNGDPAGVVNPVFGAGDLSINQNLESPSHWWRSVLWANVVLMVCLVAAIFIKRRLRKITPE